MSIDRRAEFNSMSNSEHEFYALRVLERQQMVLVMIREGQLDSSFGMEIYDSTGNIAEVLRDRDSRIRGDLQDNPTFNLTTVLMKLPRRS